MIKKLGMAMVAIGAIGGTAISVAATEPQSKERTMQLAREASEGPRGGDNERPGDRQRGRRLMDDGAGTMQLAREASEGPRGGDNERPGDRQRGRRG